jgi:hypothetical protein
MSLFKRGVSCSPLCCFCDEKNETVEHLFMECEWAISVWFASPLGVKFRYNDDSPKSFLEWLKHIIIHEEKDVIQLVMAVCYEIWWTRNKRLFEDPEPTYPNAELKY